MSANRGSSRESPRRRDNKSFYERCENGRILVFKSVFLGRELHDRTAGHIQGFLNTIFKGRKMSKDSDRLLRRAPGNFTQNDCEWQSIEKPDGTPGCATDVPTACCDESMPEEIERLLQHGRMKPTRRLAAPGVILVAFFRTRELVNMYENRAHAPMRAYPVGTVCQIQCPEEVA